MNLSQATINGFGVFFSPIPITCFPASLSRVANRVKSLSLETRQNPSNLHNYCPYLITFLNHVDLNISNQAVAFNGRFGGVATDVFVPISAVGGIYARENGQGMVFDPEDNLTPPDDTTPTPDKPERPTLKIVK